MFGIKWQNLQVKYYIKYYNNIISVYTAETTALQQQIPEHYMRNIQAREQIQSRAFSSYERVS